MPTYEYECKECGYLFEVSQSMFDEPIEECPQCGGRVQRIIGTGIGVIFKGSGFYATDYKRNSSASQTRCGRETPCCGRQTPCEKRPCD